MVNYHLIRLHWEQAIKLEQIGRQPKYRTDQQLVEQQEAHLPASCRQFKCQELVRIKIRFIRMN
jgi:hypothetical protein